MHWKYINVNLFYKFSWDFWNLNWNCLMITSYLIMLLLFYLSVCSLVELISYRYGLKYQNINYLCQPYLNLLIFFIGSFQIKFNHEHLFLTYSFLCDCVVFFLTDKHTCYTLLLQSTVVCRKQLSRNPLRWVFFK